MRPGRIVMLVLGTLSALLGLGLLAGAGAAGWANYQQRDGGYFTSPLERFSSDSYALNSPRLDVMTGPGTPDARPAGLAGRVMLRGSAADPAKAVFIGIAPRSDVEAYLTDVKHSEIIDVRFNPFRTQYREVAGTKAPARPADQPFWTVSATGPGTQQLDWDLRTGTWAVVIMNADASSPVAVDLQAGARSDLLWPIFLGLLISGILFLLIGLPLIVAGAAGLGRGGPPSSRPGYPAQRYGTQPYAGQPGPGLPYARPYAGQPYPQPGAGQPYPQPGPGQPYAMQPHAAAAYPAPGQQPWASASPGPLARAYPARLNGQLDPNLSRWMWLVKWFLAIPHFVVLFFLWFAFIVTTIVAWFAILFTGRYPRSLFNFNVGVIRWNWRVAFYAYGVLGTDLYPPFTLARTDYPADFDVDYPERLSRGLVLVKSWLLAIPHLLIVAVLTGTARTWTTQDGVWVEQGAGISLIGLLVLIAGFILLFTGQYWQGLFDLLLGLNRWIYRVIAYVSLMRDEYPPFHLDMGPADPGNVPAISSAGPPAGQPQAAAAAAETRHAVPGGPDTPPDFYGAGGPPVSEGTGGSTAPGSPRGTEEPGGPAGPAAPPRR